MNNKEETISFAIDALISVVALTILVIFNFAYRKATGSGEAMDAIFVPFELILIAFTLLLSASFKGNNRKRDVSWAILIVGVALIFVANAVFSSMMPWVVYWVVYYLPDGIGATALVLALIFASRDL